MTAPVPSDSSNQSAALDQWLARLSGAQPAEHDRRLTALEAQQTTSTVALAALAQMIADMKGTLMATAEEFATRLNDATNEVAADLQTLRTELEGVRDQIPAAQQAAVDAALAKLDEPIARLEALGQDPSNPVPDPGTGGGETPAPGDGGETPTPDPTV